MDMPTARDEQDGECDVCAPTDGRRKCTLSVLCISDSTPRLPALALATTLAQAVALVLAPATALFTSHAAWVMISVLPSLRTAGLGSVKEHFSTSKIEDGKTGSQRPAQEHCNENPSDYYIVARS